MATEEAEEDEEEQRQKQPNQPRERKRASTYVVPLLYLLFPEILLFLHSLYIHPSPLAIPLPSLLLLFPYPNQINGHFVAPTPYHCKLQTATLIFHFSRGSFPGNN